MDAEDKERRGIFPHPSILSAQTEEQKEWGRPGNEKVL